MAATSKTLRLSYWRTRSGLNNTSVEEKKSWKSTENLSENPCIYSLTLTLYFAIQSSQKLVNGNKIMTMLRSVPSLKMVILWDF